MRIAMWSGPRNISTAMMRSWGSRPDTAVSDEPLYAHYLERTDLPHPGAEEVMRAHEADWDRVAEHLTGPIPGGRAIWYQKHMAHHLLDGIERGRAGWVLGLRNCLLVREPREMVASLVKVLPEATVEETGLPQQVELARFLEAETGERPPVLVARDVLTDPAGALSALCERLGVPFREEMLRWAAGPRETDGVWAKHWYASVEASTGFEPYRERASEVAPRYAGLVARCEELFAELVSGGVIGRETRAASAAE